MVDVERLAGLTGVWVEHCGQEAEANGLQVHFKQVRLQLDLRVAVVFLSVCRCFFLSFLLFLNYDGLGLLNFFGFAGGAAFWVFFSCGRLRSWDCCLFLGEKLLVGFPRLWLKYEESPRCELLVDFKEECLDADIAKGEVDPLNGRETEHHVELVLLD